MTIQKMSRNISNTLIGFDEIFKMLDLPINHNIQKQEYPPYNLVKISDTHSMISLPVVGRTKDDIQLEVENGVLTVSVDAFLVSDSYDIVEQGIAYRSFKKSFKLHEYIKITDAKVINGLLHIYLQYIVPEEKKPQIIKIS